MRPEVVSAYEFAQDMDRIHRSDLLLSGLARVLAPLGVASISLNLIRKPGCDDAPRPLLAMRWAGWAKTYVSSGFVRDDPAVRMLYVGLRPFSWSEALERFPSTAGERVLDACFHETGCRDGYVVPFRDNDGALLTAAFCGPALDLARDARLALKMSGFHLAAHGRDLMAPPPVTSCPLTSRHLDCLRGVLHGCSDFEIGRALQISPHTVHNHIEEVKRRLGLPRRAMAAAEAWRQGWIL